MLVQLDIFSHEGTSNGRFMGLAKFTGIISNANASFSDSHISKKHDFVSDGRLVRSCSALGSHGRSQRHILETTSGITSIIIVVHHFYSTVFYNLK